MDYSREPQPLSAGPFHVQRGGLASGNGLIKQLVQPVGKAVDAQPLAIRQVIQRVCRRLGPVGFPQQQGKNIGVAALVDDMPRAKTACRSSWSVSIVAASLRVVAGLLHQPFHKLHYGRARGVFHPADGDCP